MGILPCIYFSFCFQESVLQNKIQEDLLVNATKQYRFVDNAILIQKKTEQNKGIVFENFC